MRSLKCSYTSYCVFDYKIELFFFIDFFILIEKNIVFHLKYSGLVDRPPADLVILKVFV